MLGTLHVGILLVAAVVILYADHQAFEYLRGKVQVLDKRRTMMLHHAVWVLLAGMILTGVLMTYSFWGDLWALSEFRLKMFFVGALVVNSLFIHTFMHDAFTVPFTQLPRSRKYAMVASGAVSALGWLGAAGMGLYLFG